MERGWDILVFPRPFQLHYLQPPVRSTSHPLRCMGNAASGPTNNAGVFLSFLISVLQTNGPSSGLLFDPVTAKQLIVNNAASDYVLRVLQVS